ncbi:MAG: hypothetical protein PHU85_13095, partial [Phycisphaerae bacterium]|nr:hypothetical protein [Phycisphaerae bacterium]
MFNKQVVMVAVLAALLTSFAGEAHADLLYTLDGNQTINAGADIVGTFNGTASTHWVRGTSSTYWLSAFPTATGLDFNNKTLSTTDGTSLVFNLNNQGIIDTGLPLAGGTSLSTYRGVAGVPSGGVTINNASGISMGGIDAHAYAQGNGGAVAIGTSENPIAGAIRIDSINTYVGNNNNNSTASGGTIAIYGAGDVNIQTPGGTRGNLDTHSATNGGGTINIQHHGNFAAYNIDTRANVNGNWGGGSSGNATFNGASGGAAAGSFLVNSIDTRNSSASWSSDAGAISIQGYTGVTVTTSILADEPGAAGDPNAIAGSISIGDVTAITGDITIGGAISAAGLVKGNLTLTSSGGKITLAALDLSKVGVVKLNAPGANSITGDLLNFSTTRNGLGQPTQTALRLGTSSSQSITYDPYRANNAYLGFQKYRLADTAGSINVGGYLKPNIALYYWVGSTDQAWSSTAFDGEDPFPTAAGEAAVFADTTYSYTVSVTPGTGSGPTVGAILFNYGTPYTLTAGGGTLTLDAGSNTPRIIVTSVATAHAINAPVSLAGNLSVDVQSADTTLTLGGAVSGSGKTLTKIGPGSLAMTGSSATLATANVTAGGLNASPTAGTIGVFNHNSTGASTIGAGLGVTTASVTAGTVNFNSTVGGTALTVSGGATTLGNGARVASLLASAGSTLKVADSSSALATVTTADFQAGTGITVNTQAGRLAIASQLKLAGGVTADYTPGGGATAFTLASVAGSNIADDAAARTLTLSGGSLAFSPGSGLGGPASVALINPSFETDAGTPNGWNYQAITGWTASGGAGIEQGTSRIWAPAAPPHYSGSNYKWALFQGAQTVSQSVTVAAAGRYTVSFDAVGRGGAYGPLNVKVQIDGADVSSTFTPSNTAWGSYTSNAVDLTAGAHTLSFVFINNLGGDKSSDLDYVSMAGNLFVSKDINYPNTAVAVTASSGLDFSSSTKDHNLGGLSLSGTTTLELRNANRVTFNGNVTSGAGAAAVAFGAGASNLTIAGAAVDVAATGQLTLPATAFSAGGGVTFNGAGAGTVILAGANTFAGPVSINGGIVEAGHANALGTTNTLTVNNGGELAIAEGITFSRAVTFGAGSVLGGKGTFAGSPTVAVAPGLSVGTLTIDGNPTLTGISTFEIDGTAPGQFDVLKQLAAGHTVTFGGTLDLVFSGTFAAG